MSQRAMRPNGHRASSTSVRSSSAVMAAGTMVSRLSGFVRSALLTAAIGSTAHADVFNVANTIPNMLYILLAGGVFNAVLVPQLVRALRHDDDGGEAYTQRLVTLAIVFLGAVTLVLVVAAPWITHLYFRDHSAAQTHDAIVFARYCLPQVFFYGMFVLVGQILNVRGRFGPMMWAPIANNVISVVVLLAYLVQYGTSATGNYSGGEEKLLGVGSTLGIVVQLLVLLPYLRSAGFVLRPRFDFRNAGLAHTLTLGIWTVLFVVVNQAAYIVVTRLATSGSGHAGTGYTIYANSFLITQVPHSIVTVSLATAIMPRLSDRATAIDPRGLARLLARTLRGSLAVVLPFAALLPVIATDLAHTLFGLGASHNQFEFYRDTIILFGPGLVFFTVQYLMLRGYYAIELNKTVFWNQCVVAAVNVAAAILFVRSVSAHNTSPALAAAYALAYLVGAAISYRGLDKRIGPLHTAGLVRFLVRLVLVTLLSTAAAGAVGWLFDQAVGPRSWPEAVVKLVLVGLVDLLVLVGLARLVRLTELTAVASGVARRLRRS